MADAQAAAVEVAAHESMEAAMAERENKGQEYEEFAKKIGIDSDIIHSTGYVSRCLHASKVESFAISPTFYRCLESGTSRWGTERGAPPPRSGNACVIPHRMG